MPSTGQKQAINLGSTYQAELLLEDAKYLVCTSKLNTGVQQLRTGSVDQIYRSQMHKRFIGCIKNPLNSVYITFGRYVINYQKQPVLRTPGTIKSSIMVSITVEVFLKKKKIVDVEQMMELVDEKELGGVKGILERTFCQLPLVLRQGGYLGANYRTRTAEGCKLPPNHRKPFTRSP